MVAKRAGAGSTDNRQVALGDGAERGIQPSGAIRARVSGTARALVLLGLLLALATWAASSSANEQTVGLFINDESSFDGYTLLSPLFVYGTVYLIDNDGLLVNSWDTGGGLTSYLLEDGDLLRSARLAPNPVMSGGGHTGAVRRFAWDGTLEWEFEYTSPDYMAHHDIELLPNGNVLMIAWEYKSGPESIAAGRDPAVLAQGELWPLHIIEVEPTGATGGNIVWEWHVWDHLVQDYDPGVANFGVVADHPELVDVNYFQTATGQADWVHANGMDYNEEFDQIVVSARYLSELWVIDHSTTTAEAAGHSGGNSGKGGDLLYRWGNPQAYGAGDAGDQKLFLQHDTQWIDPGLPGEGNLMIFNNGNGRPGGSYSSVDEIVPPVDSLGNYALTSGQAYGPQDPTWIYSDPPSFYSSFASGAGRLPNGNTLVNSSDNGTIFEVTPGGQTVWKYVSPVGRTGPVTQGDPLAFRETSVFRAYRYAPDYPGLAGQDLTPGLPIELGTLDSDKDGLTDDDESNIHGTDPFLADTDGDGCSDWREVQTGAGSEGAGGRRDPLHFWDFTDQWLGMPFAKDKSIVVEDIGAVVVRFGTTRGAAPTEAEAFAEALVPPLAATGYHASADRGGLVGPNAWNVGPPDGNIVVGDIGAVVAQFGHSCADE